MYALFLESRAARQIKEYVALNDMGDPEALLQAAYRNGRVYFFYRKAMPQFAGLEGLSYDDWWVSLCLRDDAHKAIDVNPLMEWAQTPEGAGFWSDVFKMKGAE